MCLDRAYRGKEKREALAKLPDEFPVWKCVYDKGLGAWQCKDGTVVSAEEMVAPYQGPAFRSIWREGELLTGRNAYKSGWHAVLLQSAARRHRHEVPKNGMLCKCRAKKKHVVAIGTQFDEVVVVLSHITFPKKCGKKPKK